MPVAAIELYALLQFLSPIGPYPSRVVSVGIVLGFQAWLVSGHQGLVSVNQFRVVFALVFRLGMVGPRLLGPVSIGISLFFSMVSPGLLEPIFVGICFGFHVWLVLACPGPVWWAFAFDFELDKSRPISACFNGYLPWFSNSVGPISLKAGSVGIGLGFQA
ncbi:hypothetical protein NC652_000180 [Populus alba x Populus x berolinensis]|nr:hypothetical protein NC652_000180 [Populus alba x Populus x berolinensis]